MNCTSCGLRANDLRSYVRIADLYRSPAVEPIRLCAACRVLNALHPQYAPLHARLDTPPTAAGIVNAAHARAQRAREAA